MKLKFIAFAIPFFLFFIGLEYLISRRRNKKVHNLNETIANINVGIAERLSDILTTGAFFFVFSWINEHFALFEIKSSVLTWILLFLLTDLVWYWYHRFGHEVNLFWSAHVVHHQSDDFNFTVAARITVLQAVFRGVFWSVLPLIGFPAGMITILLLIHGLYPFFTHTQLVGKLGWIEYIFVTPSHHRVHHSSNEEYLDKNYGDVLIIWDKIFGTYAEEKTKPVYGLTAPLNSYSFLWQHFHFILEMSVAFKRATGWKEKLKVVFGSPEAIDPRIRNYLQKKLASPNRQQHLTKTLLEVIKIETIVTISILFFSILFFDFLTAWQVFIIASFILLGVITTGAMLEQRRWIFHLEFSRIGLLGVFIFTLYPHIYVLIIVLGILTGILIFYRSITNQYYNLLYKYA